MAQEGGSPPVVASEAPVLGDGGAATEAAPLMPASSGVAPAAPEVVATTEVDTDLVSLVLKAHPVVQAVMGLLTLAVAAVLTVFLFKTVEFSLAFARLRRARAALVAAPGLAELAGDGPLAEAARKQARTRRS